VTAFWHTYFVELWRIEHVRSLKACVPDPRYLKPWHNVYFYFNINTQYPCSWEFALLFNSYTFCSFCFMSIFLYFSLFRRHFIVPSLLMLPLPPHRRRRFSLYLCKNFSASQPAVYKVHLQTFPRSVVENWPQPLYSHRCWIVQTRACCAVYQRWP